METKSNSTKYTQSQRPTSNRSGNILSESKNASFLNQELQFFMQNLQQKAL